MEETQRLVVGVETTPVRVIQQLVEVTTTLPAFLCQQLVEVVATLPVTKIQQLAEVTATLPVGNNQQYPEVLLIRLQEIVALLQEIGPRSVPLTAVLSSLEIRPMQTSILLTQMSLLYDALTDLDSSLTQAIQQ